MLKVKMMTNLGEDEDEPDVSVLNIQQKTSSVQADGSLVLAGPRKRSRLVSLFTKTDVKTKVVLVGGETRVPFMALFQVYIYTLLLTNIFIKTNVSAQTCTLTPFAWVRGVHAQLCTIVELIIICSLQPSYSITNASRSLRTGDEQNRFTNFLLHLVCSLSL